ncbi:hypothetical protein [Streptomyces sp. NPDC058861]|uniref:hypothetical protein n=1 Tax=Streptomyces sp. NPDC058861 TaxID=3346653 RepID=UPI00368C3EE3
MAVDREATRTAHDRLVEQAEKVGCHLHALDVPPADPATARRIEAAILRVRLARKRGY